jgi:hypothetical protein
MTLCRVMRRLRTADQGPAPSDSKCHRILRHPFSARSHFIQTSGSDWVFSVARQRSRYRPGIPEARVFGVFKRLHGKRTPRKRTRTRILQEGHRVAWRSNVAGIGAWGGIDILFHSAFGRLTFCRCRPATLASWTAGFASASGRLKHPACIPTHSAVGPKSAHRRPVESQ